MNLYQEVALSFKKVSDPCLVVLIQGQLKWAKVT